MFHFQFFILVRHLRRPGPSWKISPLAKCKIFIQISKPPRVRCRYVPKAGSYWDESKRENVQYHTGFPAQVKRFGRRMISASRRDALDSLCTGLCGRDRTAGRPSLPKGRYPPKPSSAVAQQHVASQPRGNGPARGSFSHTEIRIRSCFRTMEPPLPLWWYPQWLWCPFVRFELWTSNEMVFDAAGRAGVSPSRNKLEKTRVSVRCPMFGTTPYRQRRKA